MKQAKRYAAMFWSIWLAVSAIIPLVVGITGGHAGDDWAWVLLVIFGTIAVGSLTWAWEVWVLERLKK